MGNCAVPLADWGELGFSRGDGYRELHIRQKEGFGNGVGDVMKTQSTLPGRRLSIENDKAYGECGIAAPVVFAAHLSL